MLRRSPLLRVFWGAATRGEACRRRRRGPRIVSLRFPLDVGNAVELAADRLDHPQPHDVLEEAEAQFVAAFVREILEARGVGGDRAFVFNAEQAPRARGKEDRVVVACRDGEIGALDWYKRWYSTGAGIEGYIAEDIQRAAREAKKK